VAFGRTTAGTAAPRRPVRRRDRRGRVAPFAMRTLAELAEVPNPPIPGVVSDRARLAARGATRSDRSPAQSARTTSRRSDAGRRAVARRGRATRRLSLPRRRAQVRPAWSFCALARQLNQRAALQVAIAAQTARRPDSPTVPRPAPTSLGRPQRPQAARLHPHAGHLAGPRTWAAGKASQ
jgi:hypothetical protein